MENDKASNDLIELNNVVLNLVLEHHIQELEKIHSNDMTNDEGKEPIMCEKCEFTTNSDAQLSIHRQTTHKKLKWKLKRKVKQMLHVNCAAMNANLTCS